MTLEQSARLVAASNEGQIVREMSSGLTLGSVASKLFAGQVSLAGGQAYRDDLLTRCGDPRDPIEAILLEQLAILHLQAQQVHLKICGRKAQRYCASSMVLPLGLRPRSPNRAGN